MCAQGLVNAGVAKQACVGDRVRSIVNKYGVPTPFGELGTITGMCDSNSEFLVQWDDGKHGNYCAGKRETLWDLAVVS